VIHLAEISWEWVVALLTGGAAGALASKWVAPIPEQSATYLRAKEQLEAELKENEEQLRKEHREREQELKSTIREAERERRETLQQREQSLNQHSERLDQRERELNRRDRDLNRQEKDLGKRERQLGQQVTHLDDQVKEAEELLASRSGLTKEEAKAQLMLDLENQAKLESVEKIRQIEETAREMAEEQARTLIAQSVQRFAGEHIAEHATTSVPIREDQTGKIIGKEGRNIRAFSQLSGCDLLIDDTPGSVVISCFNPIRREIAKRALQRLLLDGRINIAKIEEAIRRSESELETLTRQYGESAALELEISGLHPELLKLLGRLHFTTSFAQNVLQHSVEVGAIAGMLAAELGLKPKQARRAGLLHDIGKAADQLVEGDHSEAGAALCKKYGESNAIVSAISAHHDEELQSSLLAQILSAANILSGARPGARRTNLATQLQRLEDLEDCALEFDAVDKVFAFKAGQELRVVVDNAKVDDHQAVVLARDLAQKIEEEFSFEQDIKVVVIRPTRVVSYAR
jgi:ribonucrease Y